MSKAAHPNRIESGRFNIEKRSKRNAAAPCQRHILYGLLRCYSCLIQY